MCEEVMAMPNDGDTRVCESVGAHTPHPQGVHPQDEGTGSAPSLCLFSGPLPLHGGFIALLSAQAADN